MIQKKKTTPLLGRQYNKGKKRPSLLFQNWCPFNFFIVLGSLQFAA